jgi:hypothetical protein
MTVATAGPDGTARGQEPHTVLAALSVAAAAIHFAMVPVHAGDSLVHGLGFALAAWFQAAWAALAVLRPDRRVLIAGIAGNLAIIAAWVVSRTWGLPFGDHAGSPEDVALVDAVTTGIELLLVVGSATALAGAGRARRTAPAPVAAWLPLLGVGVLTTAVLVTPSARHEHAAGDHAHAEGDAGSGADEHAHGGHGGEVTRADDWRLGATADQVAETEGLIERTQAAVGRYGSIADAEAAGYVRVNRKHLMNLPFVADEHALDPDHIESLVVDEVDGEERIVGGMYVMDVGTTVDDVPPLGGPLVVWHSHGRLCVTPETTLLPVDRATGECPEGTTAVDDIPMVHVWNEPQRNADGTPRSDEACGTFRYLDLPPDVEITGCIGESSGGGHALTEGH